MANRLIDDANKHMSNIMDMTMKAMDDIQSSKIGLEPRSQREMDAMIMKIKQLSPEEQGIRMQEIANLSGHKGDKIDDCSLCNYLKTRFTPPQEGM